VTDLERLLGDAISLLGAAGVRWAVIGGCARNAYAEPRATRDVDFVVEVDAARFGSLEQALRDRGFERASAVWDPGEPVPDLALYRDSLGRRIDLLFAHTDFERSALSRAESLAPFGGLTTHVVTAEDLIVYKLIADRPQDRADIAAVVEAQALRGHPIDWHHVERWCEAWGITERLSALGGLVAR
jgi:hypothetical protein